MHGVGKPGIKAPGTPEGVPRTAAITHIADTEKAPAIVSEAQLIRLDLLRVSYARSLNWQRLLKSSQRLEEGQSWRDAGESKIAYPDFTWLVASNWLESSGLKPSFHRALAKRLRKIVNIHSSPLSVLTVANLLWIHPS